jgi:hypothetical protein
MVRGGREFPPFRGLAQGEVSNDGSLRPHPVWQGWSPVLDARLDLELPPGVGVKPRPAMIATSQIGDYAMRSEEIAGRLVLERHLAITMDLVPAARWAEASALLRAIYRGDNAPLLLTAR